MKFNNINELINDGKFLNTDRQIIGDGFKDCLTRIIKLENLQQHEAKLTLKVFEVIEKRLLEIEAKITKQQKGKT